MRSSDHSSDDHGTYSYSMRHLQPKLYSLDASPTRIVQRSQKRGPHTTIPHGRFELASPLTVILTRSLFTLSSQDPMLLAMLHRKLHRPANRHTAQVSTRSI